MLSDGNLKLGKLWVGGGTDGRTDVWKFTPMSYKTSALWGRCPKRENKRKKGRREREGGRGKGERKRKKKKQVIQGSHMVSGTRCPAWSDQLKKWSERRAAAPKGRCPVGHRDEFPDVLRRHIKGLIRSIEAH